MLGRHLLGTDQQGVPFVAAAGAVDLGTAAVAMVASLCALAAAAAAAAGVVSLSACWLACCLLNQKQKPVPPRLNRRQSRTKNHVKAQTEPLKGPASTK